MKPAKRPCPVLFFLAVFLFVLWCGRLPAYAAGHTPRYTHPFTGYSVYIDDDEDLLTDTEEALLLQSMQGITAYGGAAFVSARHVTPESVYRSYFGHDSGTIFVIDMGSHLLTIYSDGKVYRTITKKYANIITDNVYRYATRGEYYFCARTAFMQILSLLEGRRIAQPMRHITNALLAAVFGLLGNFLYVWYKKRRLSGNTGSAHGEKPKAASSDVRSYEGVYSAIRSATGVHAAAAITRELVKSKKTRRSSDSGGSSGGGSFGGGGGGGSSGGGGSHGF